MCASNANCSPLLNIQKNWVYRPKSHQFSSFSEESLVLPPWCLYTMLSRQWPSLMPQLSHLAVQCLRPYLLGYVSRKNIALGMLFSPCSQSLEWSLSWDHHFCLVLWGSKKAIQSTLRNIRSNWTRRVCCIDSSYPKKNGKICGLLSDHLVLCSTWPRWNCHHPLYIRRVESALLWVGQAISHIHCTLWFGGSDIYHKSTSNRKSRASSNNEDNGCGLCFYLSDYFL